MGLQNRPRGALLSLLFFTCLSVGMTACEAPAATASKADGRKRKKKQRSRYKKTEPTKEGERTIVGRSKTHKIDRVIKSMFGPKGDQSVQFGDPDNPEVIWVKGAHVDVIDLETNAPASPEYLCHSHIKFRPKTFNKRQRNKNFGGTTHQNLKLFTLIQGQEEIRLPDGFGIPILSFEDFTFHAMVISNNPIEKEKRFQVESKFDWVAESDRKEPLKALFRTGISMKVPVFAKDKAPPKDKLFADLVPDAESATAGQDAVASIDARIHPEQVPQGAGVGAASSGECALPEEDDPSLNKADVTDPVDVNRKSVLVSGKFFKDGDQNMSYHWLIPPGRHQYRYKVKPGTTVPFNTTMHHATAHMHAYAKWMELRDITDNKVIYRFEVENYPDRIGIKNISHFSSSEGVKLYRKHQYELVAEYDNPTKEPIDAMAIVYMYLHDKKFDIEKARLSGPAASSQPASRPAL